MATSVIPALLDALVAQAPAYMPAGVLVLDGAGLTEDPSNFLIVGISDLDVGDDLGEAAEAAHEWVGLGNKARDQKGNVWCVAQAVSGDGVLKTARDAAYAIVAGVENLLRANPTLGVITGGWVRHGTAERFQQDYTTDQGAVARVTFQIYFIARL